MRMICWDALCRGWAGIMAWIMMGFNCPHKHGYWMWCKIGDDQFCRFMKTKILEGIVNQWSLFVLCLNGVFCRYRPTCMPEEKHPYESIFLNIDVKVKIDYLLWYLSVRKRTWDFREVKWWGVRFAGLGRPWSAVIYRSHFVIGFLQAVRQHGPDPQHSSMPTIIPLISNDYVLTPESWSIRPLSYGVISAADFGLNVEANR